MTHTVIVMPASLLDKEVITVGIQGPEGPAGISEDQMVYSKRIDFVGDTIIYRGEALPGASTSSASWRVRRITLQPDGDLTEEWADGSADFNQVWDDHLTFSYS